MATLPRACTAATEVTALHVAPSPVDGTPRSLQRLVSQAAEQIARFSAPEAFAACASDGLIIDIRSQDARERDGVIRGSLHIPRTVLEWRVALDSPWRNVHLGGLDQRLILICDHGLPVASWRHQLSAADGLPGTGPPD